MVSADTYRQQLARGNHDAVHVYRVPQDSPVKRVIVQQVERVSDRLALYELHSLDGSPLPAWQAGAHIDVVVAPEYLRQFSLTGDPGERGRYRIAVQKEADGRGGSMLMHRIFVPGRKVFISHPINHFPLHEDAAFSCLFGGGIGITPLIAMAYRLHRLGREFELHYSVRSRRDAAFLSELEQSAWADRLVLHVSDEGSRADFPRVFHSIKPGSHVYTCGPDHYLREVLLAAAAAGIPDEACHSEYFSVPEEPVRENYPFILRLQRSQKDLQVPASMSAGDILNASGHAIDIKCSDGLCGVCRCTVLHGEVDHRDFVLSAEQRKHSMILCQSRAAERGGVVTVDL
jgi:ferredoxin-NADP reductase